MVEWIVFSALEMLSWDKMGREFETNVALMQCYFQSSVIILSLKLFSHFLWQLINQVFLTFKQVYLPHTIFPSSAGFFFGLLLFQNHCIESSFPRVMQAPSIIRRCLACPLVLFLNICAQYSAQILVILKEQFLRFSEKCCFSLLAKYSLSDIASTPVISVFF